ncbi:MAG TPA: hypothetical protein VGY58_22910, partial [Gemmataceae bacterium]|nr:hypothetical protein [Gemmataceae bacterium]
TEYRFDAGPLVRRVVEDGVPNHGWLLRVDTPLAAEKRTSVQGAAPVGWHFQGEGFAFAVDDGVRHGGKYSCRIEGRNPKPAGFAMLSQTIRADNYRGERVRLSGYLKTESLEGMATLWMRVDGENGLEGIDKTVKEAVRGTSDWQQPHIVMDVPESSQTIRFAVLVEGGGKAWVDDLKFEIVDRTVPLTNPAVKPAADQKQKPQLPRRPVNLDFEAVSKK